MQLLRNFFYKPKNNKIINSYTFDEILTRFNHKTSKEVTIKDLQGKKKII